MKISTQGFRLEIQMTEPDVEGWMNTELSVDTDTFKGGFVCSIEKHEWKLLEQNLQTLYDAFGKEVQINWSNMEGNIEFDFKINRSGQLEVGYKLSPSSYAGPFLSGEFTADQSYLPQWIQSAKSHGN